MDKEEKEPRSKAIDIVLMVVTAVAVVMLGVTFLDFLDVRRVPDEWKLFFLAGIAYVVCISYYCNRLLPFRVLLKHPRRWFIVLIMTVFIVTPLTVTWALFRHNIVIIPRTLWPYLIPMILTAAIGCGIFGYLVTRFSKQGESKVFGYRA